MKGMYASFGTCAAAFGVGKHTPGFAILLGVIRSLSFRTRFSRGLLVIVAVLYELLSKLLKGGYLGL